MDGAARGLCKPRPALKKTASRGEDSPCAASLYPILRLASGRGPFRDTPDREVMMMRELKLTKAQMKCLHDQVITADQPGPVLHDFRVLLDFLGPEGVEAAGKYNLFPIKSIGELDHRLSRPLDL